MTRLIWACVALLFGLSQSADVMPPIITLATSLQYPIPNYENCCTWPGVKCFNATEPEEIVWDRFNLTGSIPLALSGPFTHLTKLSLANNVNITGTLVIFQSNVNYFPALQQLILFKDIGVGGALIQNVFTLPKIERIDLSETSVDGTINFLDLTPSLSLTYLVIESAKLRNNFPQWLDKAPNIANIKLANNQLTGTLPPNLSSLSNLIELNIANNLLTGTIPIEYASLTNLKTMRIGDNQLNGTIPDDFFSAIDLLTFEAGNTALTGTLPSSLASRPYLSQLMLPNTQFYGAFPFFAGPLTYLDVTGGAFTGTVPDWLQHKTDLQTLKLAGTSFTGTLPPLDLLTKLEELSLQNTQISGPIPKIGNPSLRVINFFNTLVSGCWSQDDLIVETCIANNTQLCCAPQACLPLGSTCVPDDSTFSEPVVVTNIAFTENTTLTMTTDATITVTSTDCVEFDGKLIIEIDYTKLNLTYDELVLMYYACSNGTFDDIEFNQVNQPACVNAQPQIQYNPSQLSLILPKPGQCTNNSIPDWSIAVIVVGGLLIVVGVLLLALYYSPVREKVFPYARK